MDMERLIYYATLGGPGHDGYAYQADTYCVTCGEQLIRELAPHVHEMIEDTDDPLFYDSNTLPQPIFFGESDLPVMCCACGEYMYGEFLSQDE